MVFPFKGINYPFRMPKTFNLISDGKFLGNKSLHFSGLFIIVDENYLTFLSCQSIPHPCVLCCQLSKGAAATAVNVPSGRPVSQNKIFLPSPNQFQETNSRKSSKKELSSAGQQWLTL
jgi:hypothetical protein